MAACTAMEPNLVAGKDDSAPRKLPIGVRTALAINTSFGRLPFPKPRTALQDKCRRSAGVTSLLLLQIEKVDAIFPSYKALPDVPYARVYGKYTMFVVGVY